MEKQVVKPAKNASVYNPKTDKPLKAGGERVFWDQYWIRRWQDKSVVLGKGPIKDALDKQKKDKAAKAEAEAKAKAEAEKKSESEAEAKAKAEAEKKGQ